MEYLPVITAVLSGLFAMLTAYYAWTLKKRDESRTEKAIRRAEKIEHFTNVYALLETAMHQVMSEEKFSLQHEFSRMNAKMELISEPQLKSQYFECCSLLEQWSKFHVSSLPPKRQFGDAVITTYQRPDPRAKYKKLADEYKEKLLSEVEVLKDILKQSLANDD
ncbi:hypothetical protein [Pseudoalteromonas luteoviolacea]|uniref:hypothetical protein n=1 Tax=Pseudoalteromonas luteoviolacea TaxID=43657 RepID=UPI001B376620|nr:hypothetical protein [Pseudoalteromonas luteoviolacea]MBQ4840050.1 hypothetical protein [Pseudoalteromonas luteoviolacea]